MDKFAKILHDLRAFPRAVVTGYAILLWDVVQWYEGLIAPTTQQTVLLTTIVGFASAIFGFYVSSISGFTKNGNGGIR